MHPPIFGCGQIRKQERSHEKYPSCHHQRQRPACQTRYLLYPEGELLSKHHLGGKGDRKVNAKSLLGVLSLGIAKGMTVTLTAEGPDEDAALEGIVALIDSGFSE